MANGRPAIPMPLQRAVLVEAGHRCAIPTCRATPVELAHIVPWARAQEHAFHNLIALCPTCHARYDKSEIDRPSMKQYKANVGLLHSRYGEMERRVLEALSSQPDDIIQLPEAFEILLHYLIRDELLMKVPVKQGVFISGQRMDAYYRLTPSGKEFVRRWRAAQPVDPETDAGYYGNHGHETN